MAFACRRKIAPTASGVRNTIAGIVSSSYLVIADCEVIRLYYGRSEYFSTSIENVEYCQLDADGPWCVRYVQN